MTHRRRRIRTRIHGVNRGSRRQALAVVAITAASAFLGPAAMADVDTAPDSAPADARRQDGAVAAPRGEVFPTPAIVVTAQRIAEAPPTLIVRDVSVADLEAYDAHTVGEGLTPVSGVNIQNGGTSGDSRAWIRGYRDRDTLVLFDGIPIASGFEGTIDLNEIATEQVAGIKVLKSAPSVIYGTNGMGGVIDIQPRNGTNASPLGGEIEVGTDERLMARASSGAGNGNLSYLLSVSHEQADDYSLSNAYRSELNQPAGDRVNSDFRRDSVFLSLDAQQTPAGHLSMFYNLSDADKGLPPTAGVEDPDYQRLTRSTRQTIGLSDQLAAIPLAVKAYYNSYDSDLVTYTDATYSEVDDVERTQDYSYGVKLYSTLHTHPHNSIVLHAAGQTDVFIGDGQLEDGNRAEITTWTAAIEDQFLLTNTLSLAAGGIYNVFEQTLLNRSSSAFNPQLALAWQTTERLALHVSAAQRTRFPKLRELYRRKYGNPDLDPQTAENYEIGLTFAHTSRFQTDMALFHSDVDGLIERPNRKSTYQNLPSVTIDGVEATTGGWVSDAFFAHLSYTYVKADESLPDGSSRQLRSRPEHTVQGEVRYRFPARILATCNGIYIAGLHDLDDDDVYVSLHSYFVANVKLSKVFNDTVSGYLAVTNLTDENYQQRLGDPREGRSLRLGFDLQL